MRFLGNEKWELTNLLNNISHRSFGTRDWIEERAHVLAKMWKTKTAELRRQKGNEPGWWNRGLAAKVQKADKAPEGRYPNILSPHGSPPMHYPEARNKGM